MNHFSEMIQILQESRWSPGEGQGGGARGRKDSTVAFNPTDGIPIGSR